MEGLWCKGLKKNSRQTPCAGKYMSVLSSQSQTGLIISDTTSSVGESSHPSWQTINRTTVGVPRRPEK